MKCSQIQREFHSNNQPTKRTETPETDNCVKEFKHIRFLEENHWCLHGKFTYTHPIVALCRRLERQRDGLKSAVDCASDLLDAAIAERDEARSRFNEIDLCKNGQAPCKWSLKLIDERDKWRDRYEIANAEHGEAVEQLSEWRVLNAWGGTPEIIHEFIKGQQDRIHYAQNVEEELAAAIAERDTLLQAIRNLRDTKGRYHTQQAFESLMTLLPTNQPK
jgi:hypothetical protein